MIAAQAVSELLMHPAHMMGGSEGSSYLQERVGLFDMIYGLCFKAGHTLSLLISPYQATTRAPVTSLPSHAVKQLLFKALNRLRVHLTPK